MYIHALSEHLREQVSELSYVPDQYIFTFHGVPQRYVQTGDPYYEQCQVTAELLASELGIEGREVFINAGGSVNTYTVIPCLNDSHPWINLLASLARQEDMSNE